MSLKLRTNDLTSHQGWFYLLRDGDQQPMTLDIFRGVEERYSFPVNNGFVRSAQGKPLCVATPWEDGCVIEKPICLTTIVRILNILRPPERPEIDRQPRLMVA